METYICLPNLLAGGLPAGALAASIASHTRGTTPTHTSNTKHTHASNTTQQKQKLELTMGGCAPTSLVRFLSAVLCFFFFNFVCVLCLKCVWVLCRACEAMEDASAPAGKPPAKRLGKHRASHPSDLNDILKKVPYFRGDFINKNTLF